MSAGASRTAIVYGASGGIGPAVLRRLDRRGYRLLLVDRDAAAAQALAAQVSQAEVWTADFTDRAALARLCERVVAYPDPIRVAVVNAGTPQPGEHVRVAGPDVQPHFDPRAETASSRFAGVPDHVRSLVRVLLT